MDAALLSRSKDLVEEKRAEPQSLPGVCHDETDVGCPFLGNTVPRHSDQLRLLSVVDFGDDGHLPVIVDVGEDVGFLRKEPPDGEESLIHRLGAQATAQLHQTRLVVGTDHADTHRGPVAQGDAVFTVSRDLDGYAYGGLRLAR